MPTGTPFAPSLLSSGIGHTLASIHKDILHLPYLVADLDDTPEASFGQRSYSQSVGLIFYG